MALLWSDICRVLSPTLGERNVKSWLAPASADVNDGRVIVHAPNRFVRDWIDQKYASDILSAAKSLDNDIYEVDVVVTSAEDDVVTAAEEIDSDQSYRNNENASIGILLDSKLTFDNFVVGKTNEFAYAAALRVAESTSAVYNPLFLYGGVGLGKTHLMHAIAWHIKRQSPSRSVVYMSAEKFMYLFIKAVRYKDTMQFKESFRSIDVLMVDDIQFICGKESTQEEFFHTFNTLVDSGRQVIISADKSPSDLDGLENRLKSRLGWGLVADIHPTTYELRLGILQSKVASLGTKVPSKVLEFLATKIVSNVRELEGALNRVVANSVLVGREISLESARDVLADLIRSNDKKITVEDIQKKVALYFDIKVSDMSSARRLKQVTVPRQIAMYLCKTMTSLSLPDIGKKFGGRDHTTVLHAVRKITEAIKTDSKLLSDINYLKETMNN